MDDDLKQRTRELRDIGVSVNDFRRQLEVSEFDIYEVLDGYDAAVKRKARKHLVRGNAFKWEDPDVDPERPSKASDDPVENAARGVVSYMKEIGNLDAVPAEERRRVLDVVAGIVRAAGAATS